MVIFLESKKFDKQVNQVEKWYGGEYSRENLNKSFLADLGNRESNPKFAIPGPNIFMPDNFDIEKLETGENDDLDSPKFKTPNLVFNDDVVKIWHYQDIVYNTPKGRSLISYRHVYFSLLRYDHS